MRRDAIVGLTRSAAAFALAAAGIAGPIQGALADERPVMTRGAHVVKNDAAGSQRVTVHPLHRDREGPARVVVRPIAEPDAVVRRELSDQPVLPHLVELRIGGTTALVDPEADYRRPTGGLDRGHSLLRAQRAHAAVEAERNRVVRSPRWEAVERHLDRDRDLTPRAILFVPDLPPRPAPKPNEAPSLPEVRDHEDSPNAPIPHVPAPSREKRNLLVLGY